MKRIWTLPVLGNIGRYSLIATVIWAASTGWQANAESVDRPVPFTVKTSQPAGFADLVEQQTTMVDVYFGGRPVGSTQVRFGLGHFSFLDPPNVVALLPDITDSAAIISALSQADLPSNMALACAPVSYAIDCGKLSPAIAGVIFDQDRFRVDVFVNPALIQIKNPVGPEYLPQPEKSLSIINGIGAVLSGTNGGPQNYDLQNRLIIGYAASRLRADIAYSSSWGLQADRIVAEQDDGDWRYSAGAFWAPGLEFLGRTKMVGVGVQSQADTRRDKELARGSPIVVFLNERSRVDIFRQGRLVASRIYDSGNQALDTSGLPDGSYELVLRIEASSGGKAEQRRFFSKNPQIAAMGQTIMFAYAGVRSDEDNSRFISVSRKPILQAGMARRLGSHLAVDGTLILDDNMAMGEVGGYLLTSAMQVRLSGLALSDGAYGGLFQMASSGNSPLNYNLVFRHFSARQNAQHSEPRQNYDLNRNAENGLVSYQPLRNISFDQLSGNASYSMSKMQFGISGLYRTEPGGWKTYSIGPSFRWDFLQKGPLNLTLNGDFTRTDKGNLGYVGVGVRLLGARTSANAGTGYRSGLIEDGRRKSGATAGIAASWQNGDPNDQEIGFSAAYDRDIHRSQFSGGGSYRSRSAAAVGNIVKVTGTGSGLIQYSAGFNTAVALKDDVLSLEAGGDNESMIVATIESESPASRFELIVNEGSVGTISGNGSLAVSLPAYKAYRVRVRPVGDARLAYDSADREVSLYPGNVTHLSWKATPITAMFGKVILADGKPLIAAKIEIPGGISETDSNGYFMIEGSETASLIVRSSEGGLCTISIPEIQAFNNYKALGPLVCQIGKALHSNATNQYEANNESD